MITNEKSIQEKLEQLKKTLINYEEEKSKEILQELISMNINLIRIVNEAIIPAATIIGEKFEKGEYFLPELLQCADLLQSVMNMLIRVITTDERFKNLRTEERGRVVIATVFGDIHDIGKNLVSALLKAHGFEVYDLGKDVESMKIVEKAMEVNADIIALSALMVTTREAQREVIQILKELNIRDKFYVMIGGGSTSLEWAKEIEADAWGETAIDAVRLATEFMKKKTQKTH